MAHEETKQEKSFPRSFFVEQGRKGGKMGGHLAWASLDEEERTEKAQKMADARWRPWTVKKARKKKAAA
jgi:hypothetical protein